MIKDFYEAKLERFYNENQEWLEEAWEDYVSFGEWGSGSDRITPCDDMFWEWVGDRMDEQDQEAS